MKSRFTRTLLPRLILAATCGAVVLASAHGRAGDDRPLFVRGDVDGDGRLAITDAIGTLRLLFRGEELPCAAAADVDDNGRVELTDAIVLLNFLFRRGQRPPFPFPFCGADPTPGDLPCGVSETTCPTTLSIFGEPIAADSVVFLVDHSGSMSAEGQLEAAKDAVAAAVLGMRNSMRFAVVFFDRRIHPLKSFPGEGVMEATPMARKEAQEFVRGMGFGGGSCPREALLHGLERLQSASAQRSVLIYLGDTGIAPSICSPGDGATAYLESMVETVTRENRDRAQIYAFGIVPPPDKDWPGSFTDLAQANGGRYIEVHLRAGVE